MKPLIIGTRASELALVQSGAIRDTLKLRGNLAHLERVITQGDKETHLSLDKLEGKGFFTTEIEQALRAGRIDLAVHSLKDLPAEDALDLCVAAVPSRVDPADALVVRPEAYVHGAPHLPLKEGVVVGTSAIRRKAQLAAHRPDLRLYDLRGNVPTRIRRLREGRCDALVIAQAGLLRLRADLEGLVHVPLSPTVFVPAPGQGALALQCRTKDEHVRKLLAELHDADDAELIAAERSLLRLLEAGCHVPLGAYARRDGDFIVMSVFYGGDARASSAIERAGHRFDVRARSAALVAEEAFARLRGPLARQSISPKQAASSV